MKKSFICFLCLFLFNFIQSCDTDKNIPIQDIDTLQYLALQTMHQELQQQADRAFKIVDEYKQNEKQDLTDEFESIVKNFTHFNNYPVEIIKQPVSLSNLKNQKNKTIIDSIIDHDNENFMKILLDHDTNVFVCDKHHNNYFHDMARFNAYKVASVILQHDINVYDVATDTYKVNQKKSLLIKSTVTMRNDKNGNTPLHIAIEYCSIEIIPVLVQAYNCGFFKNNEGKTPLAWSLDNYSPKTILKILECTYNNDHHDLNDFRSIKNNSYLHLLVKHAQRFDITAVLEKILEKNIDINIQNNNGNTAVHLLAQSDGSHSGKALALLLLHHPNVNFKSVDGRTPLIANLYATKSDLSTSHNDYTHHKFKMLLDAGADHTILDNDDHNTLLHIAALLGCEFQAKFLLEKDAILVHAVNKDNQTALHLAMMYHYHNIARQLVSCGADIYAQDIYGKTPLQYLNGQEWPNAQPFDINDFRFYYDNDMVMKELISAYIIYRNKHRPLYDNDMVMKVLISTYNTYRNKYRPLYESNTSDDEEILYKKIKLTRSDDYDADDEDL